MNNLAMWGFWSTSRAVEELPNNLTGVVLLLVKALESGEHSSFSMLVASSGGLVRQMQARH